MVVVVVVGGGGGCPLVGRAVLQGPRARAASGAHTTWSCPQSGLPPRPPARPAPQAKEGEKAQLLGMCNELMERLEKEGLAL